MRAGLPSVQLDAFILQERREVLDEDVVKTRPLPSNEIRAPTHFSRTVRNTGSTSGVIFVGLGCKFVLGEPVVACMQSVQFVVDPSVFNDFSGMPIAAKQTTNLSLR